MLLICLGFFCKLVFEKKKCTSKASSCMAGPFPLSFLIFPRPFQVTEGMGDRERDWDTLSPPPHLFVHLSCQRVLWGSEDREEESFGYCSPGKVTHEIRFFIGAK